MPAADSAKLPVVLVHGIFDTSRKMRHLARHLAEAGYQVHTPSLCPSSSVVGLDVLAAQLRDWIAEHLGAATKFHLVGFSMGGLITRYYVQRLGGLARVSRYITISAPHRGSLWAWLLPTRGCRQMRAGSEFLRDLEMDAARLEQVGFASVWTPLDVMIMPARSSATPFGKVIRMPVLLHAWMVSNRRSLQKIAELLSEKLPG